MVVFLPFQYLYHRECNLLVDCLRYWRRYSAPSPRIIHIYTGIFLTVWSDLPAIFRVGTLRSRIESSCGRVFSRSRTCIIVCVLSLLIPYIFYVGDTLLCLYPYIHLRADFDCLSRPSSHILSRTSEEEYRIFLWSDFSCSEIFIIEGVLSWSIPYIIYVGSLLLCIDPYIHLREYC